MISQICRVTAVALLSATVGAQAANPISQAIRDEWNGVKSNLQRSATAMPEAKFGFKPVNIVRTYGQILAHVAGANYIFCSAARGEKSPLRRKTRSRRRPPRGRRSQGRRGFDQVCDAAYTALDNRRGGRDDRWRLQVGKTARAAALMGNSGHVQEHYGNLVPTCASTASCRRPRNRDRAGPQSVGPDR